jgi:hypothetical protein
MSAAPHLRLIDTETGEVQDHTSCPRCAEAIAEAEAWERKLLAADREIQRMKADKDAKMRADKLYPEAERLFQEWQEECGHPNSEFGPDRIRLALAALKLYKGEKRVYLSWAILGAKHGAFVDDKGEKHDRFGLIFRGSEEIEKNANRYARWKRTHVCPTCKGDGEIRGNRSNDGDPQADDVLPCSGCGGTGVKA